jgi:cyclic beta-1,2-glucan synthetase
MPNAKPNVNQDIKKVSLRDLSAQLAKQHTASVGPGLEPSPLERLSEQGAFLQTAYEYFVRKSESQKVLSSAAEWLLDNFYVVQQALRQIHKNMPAGYYRQLPKLDTPPLKGYPRAYHLAGELLRHLEGHLDVDQVTRFISAYQDVTPLTMGELWALPTMLRLGLVEILTQMVARIMEDEPQAAPESPWAVSLPEELDQEIVVANAIRSLRTLANQDWDAFFESLSRVEAALRDDPASVYAAMDFDTRDRYRSAVEEMARAADRPEGTVARAAVRLAETAKQKANGSRRTRHVGYYLIDRGRPALEAELDYRPARSDRLRRWLGDRATLLYLGGMALLTLAILAGLAGYALWAGATPLQWIGALLL